MMKHRQSIAFAFVIYPVAAVFANLFFLMNQKTILKLASNDHVVLWPKNVRYTNYYPTHSNGIHPLYTLVLS